MDAVNHFLTSTLPMIVADVSALVALIWTIVQHYTKQPKG